MFGLSEYNPEISTRIVRKQFRNSARTVRTQFRTSLFTLSSPVRPIHFQLLFFIFIFYLFLIFLYIFSLIIILIIIWINAYCLIRAHFCPKKIYFFSVHFILNEIRSSHFLTSEIFLKISSLKSLATYHPENHKIF